MSAQRAEREHLSIELDHDLLGKVRSAAEVQSMSVPDFVVNVLRQTVTSLADQADAPAWARLSAPSFARDWDSEEDAAYDAVAQG